MGAAQLCDRWPLMFECPRGDTLLAHTAHMVRLTGRHGSWSDVCRCPAGTSPSHAICSAEGAGQLGPQPTTVGDARVMSARTVWAGARSSEQAEGTPTGPPPESLHQRAFTGAWCRSA
jgi:hypothetical protein